MKTQNFLLNGLSVESQLNLEPGQLATFEQSLVLAQERFKGFANDPAFPTKMVLAFGDNVNVDRFQSDWQLGDFSVLSEIETIGTNEINVAKGAYSSSTNKIYLSLDF